MKKFIFVIGVGFLTFLVMMLFDSSSNKREQDTSPILRQNTNEQRDAVRVSKRVVYPELITEDFLIETLAHDLEGTIAHLARLDGQQPYDMIASTLYQYATDNGDWALMMEVLNPLLEHPDISSYLFPHAVVSWGEMDYDSARVWLFTRGVDNGALREAANQLGARAYANDVTLSKDFLNAGEFKKHPSAVSYLTGYIEGVAHHDVEAVTEVLEMLPEGPLCDYGIYTFLAYAKELDPEVSQEWVALISDEGLRQSAFAEITGK